MWLFRNTMFHTIWLETQETVLEGFKKKKTEVVKLEVDVNMNMLEVCGQNMECLVGIRRIIRC